MNTKLFLLVAFLANASLAVSGKNPDVAQRISAYNVVWTEQSNASYESMPLSGSQGNGANVWVQDGDIFLYLGNNECYDENSDLLKPSCVRIHLDPNPFEPGETFRQELDLYHSEIIISGKLKSGLKGTVRLWYNLKQPALHAHVETSSPVKTKVSFATWRDRTDSVDLGNYNFKGKSRVFADSVEQSTNAILWYHRNRNEFLIAGAMVEKQRFGDYKNIIQDFTKDLIFGGMVSGKGLKEDGSEKVQWQKWSGTAWHLSTAEKSKVFDFVIVPQVGKPTDLKIWRQDLRRKTSEALARKEKSSAEARKWWSDFWQRSYIFINEGAGPEDLGWQVGRNYQLFRYMWACNKDGKLPLKFNGGIFTTDPPPAELIRYRSVPYKINEKVTPDYRRWGNLFMAQNQRLIGWPGLASGDFDLMLPSLDFYVNRLSVAEARSKAYWNHAGAAFFEPLDLSGLPVNRLASSSGPMSPAHLKYHLSMQVEFAFMAVQFCKYSGADIRNYQPFIVSVARFFDEHYRMENKNRTGKEYDANGKLVLYPLNSLELFSETTDPVEVIAGLTRLTEEMLSFPKGTIPDTTIRWFSYFREHIPDIPFEVRNGKKVISPARVYGKVYNATDFPEMYAVWPFGIYHFGKTDGFAEANNTWENLPEDRQAAYGFWSWMCTPVYAAVLGRTADSKRLIIEKLSDKNCNLKFPAFFGPGNDWMPDHNWGGSGMVALQNMLLYSESGELNLFPAWPNEWNVSFRLHALNKTTVECSLKNGRITSLHVSPDQKVKDFSKHN